MALYGEGQRLQYGVDRIEDGGWVVLEDGDARCGHRGRGLNRFMPSRPGPIGPA